MRVLFCLAFVFAAAHRAPCHAQQLQKVTEAGGISEYRLANGLRLLLLPDASRPTVTVSLTVLVGSRHEGYGEAGMAHLLEHLLFKGTPSHPNIPRALQERGARYNGTTGQDRTNYYETLPAGEDNLEFALRLEADRLVNSFLRRDDLLSEMTVVRNEFEMGEGLALPVLRQRMLAAAYEWHNYGRATTGNRSDIERVPMDNLRAFYKKFYRPDSCVLVVAGTFDSAKALVLVERFFGPLRRPGEPLQETITTEPPQDGERAVRLERTGGTPVAGVLYHVCAGAHPDFAALQVLGNILDAVPSGRLRRALVETGHAASVSAGVQGLRDPGVFMALAELTPGTAPEKALGVLCATLERVGTSGVTEEEVARARHLILHQYELAANDTSLVAVSLSNWAAQGDWRLYLLHRERVEKVTRDEIRAVAARYFLPSNRTTGLYVPTALPLRVTIPAAPPVQTLFAGMGVKAKDVPDPAGKTPRSEVPARYETLNHGLKVALLPRPARGGTVNLRLTLRYGNEKDLRGLITPGSLLPQLMARGTRKLSYEQLQDEWARLKSRLVAGGATAGFEGMTVAGEDPGTATFSLEARRESLPAAWALLLQVQLESISPAFRNCPALTRP